MRIFCNFCGKEFTNTNNMMIKYLDKYYVCVYCEEEVKELKRLRNLQLKHQIKHMDLCSLYPNQTRIDKRELKVYIEKNIQDLKDIDEYNDYIARIYFDLKNKFKI